MVESTSYAQVLDLISEGEIGGLVNGAKSIFLNETPAMNDAGQMNFEGFTYVAANGTNTQGSISGFDQVRNEINVGVEVTVSGGAIVRTISNTNVTSFLMTVQMPALYYSNDDGGQDGTDISYAVEYRPSGGAWTTAITESFNGKATTAYEKQYRVKLTGSAPWSIRLRRITPDSTNLRTQNKTYFKSYTEVIDAKMRYPNSAVIGTRFDSKAFNAIPRRAFDVKLLKIKIPSNATVRDDGSLTYSGSWNGTFQTAWSANPAWCFYDLLTNERYGLGKFLPASQIDKWGLYQIGQYCDELVPNGFGGTEPRFTCNIWINNRREAFQVLNDFTSIFRGMAYWGAGSLTAVQDAPKASSYLFTNANVVDGRFTYQGSSSKARHTVALVAWNDLSDMGRAKVEYVEDTAGIDRYGIIETEVTAIGCTSRGQANRVGRWLLYSERHETEVVMFKTGTEGALVKPGDVITVADQHRAGARMGGRISAATSTTVTVDSLASAPAAGSTLYVIAPDGSVMQGTIASVSGNTITVSAAFASTPAAQSAWVISTTAIAAQTFRVLTVAETDAGEHEITGLAHDPAKYAYVEQNIALPVRDYTDLNVQPDVVGALVLSESLYAYQSDVRSKLTVAWPQAANATTYRVEWSKDKANFVTDETGATSYDIMNTTPGNYVVRVTAIGALGKEAQTYSEGSISALGKTLPPSDVTGFTFTVDSLIGVTLKWNNVTDLDLDQYEIRQGASWAAGTIVTRVKANTYKLGAITGAAQTYWVKAIDTSGIYSANAASLATSFSAPSATTMTVQVIDNNVLLKWDAATSTLAIDYYEIRRGSTWAGGTVVGRVSNATFTTLFETAGGTYTYWIAGVDIGGNVGTPTSAAASVSQPPDYVLFANYQSTFNGTLSSAVLQDGAVFFAVNTSETVQSHFTARSWSTPQDQINAGYAFFIEPTATSGYYEETLDYGATLASSKITITPTYATQFGSATVTPSLKVSADGSTWTDFGAVTDAYATSFRYVRFRLTVTASGGDDLVQLSALNFRLDAKQKSDAGMVSAVSSDSGGTTVNFNVAFTDVASITLTPLGTSARYAIYDFADVPNPTSFKVLLYDSAGTRVSGTVSWTARGY